MSGEACVGWNRMARDYYNVAFSCTIHKVGVPLTSCKIQISIIGRLGSTSIPNID